MDLRSGPPRHLAPAGIRLVGGTALRQEAAEEQAQGGTGVKGIIFDKDGTLFDFQATWAAFTRALIATESAGDPGRAVALAQALGYDADRGLILPGSVVIAHTTRAVAETILPLIPGGDLTALLVRMDQGSAAAPQAPAADLPAVMAALKARGLVLGLATNDSEAPARVHLAKAGIAPHFDFVAGFDSGWGGKPAPGQLIAFARAMRLDPADCAMVGDSLHDLTAARAAGMIAIGVLTGIAQRNELETLADLVLPSIADLAGWLDCNGEGGRNQPIS